MGVQYNLLVAHNQAIANLFPEAKVDASNNLIINHGLAETVILRRHGIMAPAPILNQYKFTGARTPFQVQKITCEMLSTNHRGYVLSGMGVGKTACPLWTFDFLRQTGHARKMLVVCPLSTMDFVWMAEMLKVESPYKAVVLHGSKAKRLKLLASDADIYIINHDGVATIFAELMARTDIDVLCLDELAVYRNKNDRTDMMRLFIAGGKTRDPIKWAWGMTGSPTPQAPTDAYHQAKMITPWTVPAYWSRFREQTMYKQSEFRWVPQKDHAEKVHAALQPSVRFTLEDVSELPPYISRTLDVAMGPRQRTIYEAIRKDALAIVGSQTVSAVNQGVILNKLLQISIGYVYDNTKGVVTLDNAPTLSAIDDILESTDDPVLFAVPYVHALDAFMAHVTQRGNKQGRNRAARVSGSTAPRARAEIFGNFQNGQYDALFCHPQCAAHGLTLTTASVIVWTGPIASLEIYDQFNARIRRVGQTKKQQYIHLQRTAAERKMYRLLVNKQDVQKSILKLFDDEIT